MTKPQKFSPGDVVLNTRSRHSDDWALTKGQSYTVASCHGNIVKLIGMDCDWLADGFELMPTTPLDPQKDWYDRAGMYKEPVDSAGPRAEKLVEGYHDRKFDAGKPRIDLIPGEALEGVGEILAYGAAKYAEDSWQLVPDAEKRYRAALLRHMAAILRGEVRDPESGKLHIDHVATNAAFLQFFARRK